MILPDFEIARLCVEQNLLTPYEQDLVNPASIDIRLGTTLLIEEEEHSGLRKIDIGACTKKNPFPLGPGQFVLAESLEIFKVPNSIAGQFALKSSLARAGFEHLLAGWIDPGFCNSVLTLELKNALEYHNIFIWPGMRIGQVVWHRMSAEPIVSYSETGRYNGDVKVTESKGIF
ncbi:MAG: dCTP deaminase [Candidatus Thorarchaeota archaeon]